MDTDHIILSSTTDDNPHIGYCSDCGFSVWGREPRLEEKGKVYHIVCRLLAAQKLKYEGILLQAEKALKLTGHKPSCRFTGCSCGATQEFRIESGEFFRQLYQFKTSAK